MSKDEKRRADIAVVESLIRPLLSPIVDTYGKGVVSAAWHAVEKGWKG